MGKTSEPQTTQPLFSFEELKEATLFSSLKRVELKEVWDAGKVKVLKKSEVFSAESQELGFLNVVLQGQIFVKRFGPITDEPNELHKGRVFGPIDATLGRALLKSATAESDSVVFTLSQDGLAKLFKKLPDFHKQVSLLRCSAAASKAREYEDKLKKQSDKEDIRVVPRLSVWERNVSVTIEDGTIRRVHNISASGLGILGRAPVATGELFSFVFEGSALNMPALEMKGTVARADEHDFGVALAELSAQIRTAWEEMVFRAMEVEIATTFKATVMPLEEPRAVHFEARGFLSPGQILAMSPEGVLLESEEALPADQITLVLPLEERDGEIRTFQIQCKVLERQAKGYLLAFVSLDEDAKNAIEQSVSPKEEAPPCKEEEPKARVTLETGWALCALYFHHLKNNIVMIDRKDNQHLGDAVCLEIHVNDANLITGKKRSFFIVSGTISRQVGARSIVEISESCWEEMSLIRNSVERFAREQLDTEFARKSARKTHIRTLDERSDPSSFRVIALVILLLLCVGAWALIFLGKLDLVPLLEKLPLKRVLALWPK